MKSVLMSIKPEWCAKIASEHKTIEIRKTKPSLPTPFKVYIYCTEPNTTDPHKYLETHSDDGYIYKCNGNVFAEFVCEEIKELAPINRAGDDLEEKACMNREEIVRYLKGKGYAWYISDLVIYNKPKELNEFKQCHKCPYGYEECTRHEYSCNGAYNVQNPPQSWCYVNEVQK